MIRLLFFCLLFAGYNNYAQTFLGNSKAEILASAYDDFAQNKIAIKDIDTTKSYIKVVNGYETLYYHLEDNVCTEFVVVKPYSCNCLEVDITAYNENCITIGDHEWISKDQSKKYKMTLNEGDYAVSVVLLENEPVPELPKNLTAVEK